MWIALFIITVVAFIAAMPSYSRAEKYRELRDKTNNPPRRDRFDLKIDTWTSTGTILLIIGFAAGLAWLIHGVIDFAQLLASR